MTPEDHRKRYRPIVGGVSVSGPWSQATGTNGMTVIDAKDQELAALSNDHVYGFSPGVGVVTCMQPGTADREQFTDPTARFGTLKRVADDLSKPDPLSYAGIYVDHYVDSAIAKPDQPELLSKEILEIGVPKGVKASYLNLPVQKSGRTSGLTKGKITAEHATVFVGYQNPMNYFYRKKMVDQILTSKMLDAGDSGSILLTEDGYVVGLGFAGSDQVSVFNRWENVERLMQVKLPPSEVPPIPPTPPEEKLLQFSIDEGNRWEDAKTIRVRPKGAD